MNEHDLVSPTTYKWFVTSISILLAAWAFYDIVKWLRLRGQDARDPLVRDKIWGYALGIGMGILTVVGVLRYHGVV